MKALKWLTIVVMALLFLAGCADGVIFQRQDAGGRVDRLRLDTAQGWNEYDTTPRYRSNKPKDGDGYGIVMMNETTF